MNITKYVTSKHCYIRTYQTSSEKEREREREEEGGRLHSNTNKFHLFLLHNSINRGLWVLNVYVHMDLVHGPQTHRNHKDSTRICCSTTVQRHSVQLDVYIPNRYTRYERKNILHVYNGPSSYVPYSISYLSVVGLDRI